MKDRGVRIVKKAGARSSQNVDVYDLETGDKILNVYGVHIDVTRTGPPEAARITVTTGDAFEYEGPGVFLSDKDVASGEYQVLERIREAATALFDQRQGAHAPSHLWANLGKALYGRGFSEYMFEDHLLTHSSIAVDEIAEKAAAKVVEAMGAAVRVYEGPAEFVTPEDNS